MISSMTAFARIQEQTEFGVVQWEIRSVNQRFLDLNFRLPEFLRHLEMPLRELVRKKISRGKCDINLKIATDAASQQSLSVNHSLIDTLVKTHSEVANKVGNADRLTTLQLMQWPGVLEEPETDEKARDQTLLALFDDAMEALIKGRQREGDAMKQVILERVHGINDQLNHIRTAFPEIQQAQRDKILVRFNELSIEPESERLEQELVFLAQKSDIAEEVDRLVTHLAEIERILTKGGQVGRRLDFLMQELNREANTIGSKSIAQQTTAAAVEMKVLIEQMREQIQNLE